MTGIRRSRKLSLVGIFVLTFVFVVGTTVAAFADVIGAAGEKFKGPDVNTFAQNMNVQTIYIDKDKMGWQKPVANSVTGTELLNPANTGAIDLAGSQLRATGTKTFTGYGWKYVYEDAAVYPDGTRGNVVMDCTLDKIYSASLDGANNTSNLVTPDTGTFSGTVRVFGGNESNHPGANVSSGNANWRAVKVYVTCKVSVTNSSTFSAGTYIIPITGVNAYKGLGGAWLSLYKYVEKLTDGDPQKDVKRIRKEEFSFSGEMYLADNAVSSSPGDDTKEGLMFYDSGKTVAGNFLGKSSVDDWYTYGLAVEGAASGTALNFQETGGYANGTQANSIKLQWGDLQHRIWSGSGPHGSIATDVKGDTTGDELKGGEFTGDIPSGKPATNTDEQKLMRYVIPDDKKNVTYTMTPEKGYTLEKVVVDGNTYTVPDVPKATATIASDDGNGTLTYLGGGKFTYTFSNANKNDHEIYVTWKKVKADIQVDKVWYDNSKAPNDAKVKLTWGSIS